MEKRNISIASKNGYTLEKVLKAKEYLNEIGSGRRTFPFEKLVTYYNELFNTKESVTGCRCNSPKFYNGIQNYFKYGKLTLINNGLATEDDFILKEEKVEEIDENRIDLGKEEIVSDALKDDDIDSTKEEVKEEVIEEKNEVVEKPKKGRPKKN